MNSMVEVMAEVGMVVGTRYASMRTNRVFPLFCLADAGKMDPLDRLSAVSVILRLPV